MVTIYEDEDEPVTIEPKEKSSSDAQGLMIIVSSAIVGLLVLVAIVMGIRFWNKSHQKGLKADEV